MKRNKNLVAKSEILGTSSSSKGETSISGSINFLQDVNPDSCIDLLSIPDPPSPSKKRCRRRTLSPLTDLTNNSSSRYAKRSRKSLAQIPLSKSSLIESSTDNGTSSNNQGESRIWPEKEDKVKGLDLLDSTDYSSSKSGREQRSVRRRRTMQHIPTASSILTDNMLIDDGQISTAIKIHEKEGTQVKKLDLLGAIDYSTSEESEAVPGFVRRRKSFHCGPTEDSKNEVGRKMIRNENNMKLEIDPCRDNSDATRNSIHFKETDCHEKSLKSCNDGRHMPESASCADASSEVKAETEKLQLGSVEVCNDDFTRDNTEDFVGRRRKKRHSLDLNIIKDAQREFEHGSSGESSSNFSQRMLTDEMLEDEVGSQNNAELVNQPSQQVPKTQNNPKSGHQCKDNDACNDGGDKKVTAYFEDLVKYGANIQRQGKAKARKARSTNNKDKAREGMEDESLRIRKLVRQYCSLSESERAHSNKATEIQNMTGYPLVAPERLEDKEEISGQDAYEKQRVLFTKLVPIVERMDQNKVKECKLYEEMTGYRAEKSRGKKFRYFSTSTNTRISPQDYQKIYTEVQQKLSAERSKGISEFLEKHQQKTTTQVKIPISINETKEDEDTIKLKESKSKPSITNKDVKDKNIPIQESNSTLGHQPGLPLPARDKVPSNLDIRLAHKELWETIDAALELYSHRVLALQADGKIERNKCID